MLDLKFLEIENDSQWDSLVLSLDNYSFLLSSFRYKYKKEIDERSFRFAIYNGDMFQGVMCGSFGKTKLFGKYLEFKHSPMLKDNSEEIWRAVLEKCKNIAQENGCFMFRISPLYVDNMVLEGLYRKLGMKKSPIQDIDAMISQYVDLSKTEEELRHDMSDSTRNNINKLTKNPDISVKIFKDNTQFDIFADFHNQTMQKKGYTDRSTKSLLRELQLQVDAGSCYMVVGYYQNKPISIWQATVYGKYMHIYQAGSDTLFRDKNIRITYLLYWECVKLAKELGCKTLDLFGGMVPEGYDGKKHPWAGVSAFKRSLGGKRVTYMHSRDYAINKAMYNLYYMYSYLRTVLKGYPVNW